MAKKTEYSDMKEGGRVDTVFSDTTSFNGVLKFNSSLKIEGKFKGKIISKGHLIIAENAKIRANVKAYSIVIAGEIRGDVEAFERLEMLSSGKLYGNIKTKKLKMADGVIFEGSCEMLRNITKEKDTVLPSFGTAVNSPKIGNKKLLKKI